MRQSKLSAGDAPIMSTPITSTSARSTSISPQATFLHVADSIGKPADDTDVKAFVDRHSELIGQIEVAGIERPLSTTRVLVEKIARGYLHAVQQAGEIYRHIESAKAAGTFITEVSMDETDAPQSPLDMLVILAAIADQRIPIQTIAPKFTGRFNKGVDYVGDVKQFAREFDEDLAIIALAVEQYDLPHNLNRTTSNSACILEATSFRSTTRFAPACRNTMPAYM